MIQASTNPADSNYAIGIILYDGFDSLDVAGPQQVFYILGNLTGIKVHLIGPDKDKLVTSYEGLHWKVTEDYASAKDLVLNTIFVPGGNQQNFNEVLLNANDPFYDFLKRKAETAELITAVCVGSLLLAHAGLLDGYECTTHWAYKNLLSLFPEVMIAPGFPRYVIDRNRITGGGISSGIDEAFAIAEILKGPEVAKQVQLIMQYAPNPPIQSGDPSLAGPQTLQKVASAIDSTALYDQLKAVL